MFFASVYYSIRFNISSFSRLVFEDCKILSTLIASRIFVKENNFRYQDR